MKRKSYRGKYAARKHRSPLWLWPITAVLLVIGLSAVGKLLLQQQNIRADHRQPKAPAYTTGETLVTETVRPTASSEPTSATTLPTAPEETAAETASASPEPLARYEALYAENPEIFGWMRIEDTALDYPVMHTPQDPEKYLHKDFYGNYSYGGVPFLDYRCREDSDNLVIYGHNMSDGSMFRTILGYQEKNYWQVHPVIRFDSLYEEREFEVVAAFYDRVYYTHETNFKFYNFIDAADEAEYRDAIAKFRSKALYDTGIVPAYGQQLITLVTCAYHVENGRFVVVACERNSDTNSG